MVHKKLRLKVTRLINCRAYFAKAIQLYVSSLSMCLNKSLMTMQKWTTPHLQSITTALKHRLQCDNCVTDALKVTLTMY